MKNVRMIDKHLVGMASSTSEYNVHEDNANAHKQWNHARNKYSFNDTYLIERWMMSPICILILNQSRNEEIQKRLNCAVILDRQPLQYYDNFLGVEFLLR